MVPIFFTKPFKRYVFHAGADAASLFDVLKNVNHRNEHTNKRTECVV